jgi:chromosome partitioning protein
MPKIITVYNQKGGTGKTTLSLSLYDVFAGSAPTALLEADKQKSLSHIKEVSGLTTNLYEFRGIDHIKALPEKVAIVDCPPVPFDGLESLLGISDFILIPSRSGYTDLFALRATVEKVKESGSEAAIVLNAVKSGTKLTNEISDLLGKYGLPVLKTLIADRVCYARSAITGTVYGQGDTKAEVEMSNLVNEVYSKLI